MKKDLGEQFLHSWFYCQKNTLKNKKKAKKAKKLERFLRYFTRQNFGKKKREKQKEKLSS